MFKKIANKTPGLWVAAVLLTVFSTQADEGMWLFSDPPIDRIRKAYGFAPSQAWLDHLRLSSVKFGNGGSAEFVSEEGLILSNQHVGSGWIQRLSTPDHNYTRDGFYARKPSEELACPGLEVRVLVSMADVTSAVNEPVKPEMNDTEAFAARRGAIARIEKEAQDKTGLRCDVVTLYQGAEYHLYRYKVYTDVRLVFAPEEQIGFYGGDPDNFEYPRYDLDISFFRAYESGTPARTPNYLKWNKAGGADGELVFISGHPGRTDRLRTMAELTFLRDVEFPRTLARLKRSEVALNAFSQRSKENMRRARAELRGVENSRKVRDGSLAGLMDPQLMKQKEDAEAALRGAVAKDPTLSYAAGAWDRIARAQQNIASNTVEYDLLERAYGFNSVLFSHARQLLRSAAERNKPNGDRLEEYRESSKASLERGLFAQQPVYADLEAVKLADSLTYLAEQLGYTNPIVQRVLAGTSPSKRAAALVNGSRLGSADVRKQLYHTSAGDPSVLRDPMIQLAEAIDQEARAVRKKIEVETEAIRRAHALIGKARYAIQGSAVHPDATSTLRLAYGKIAGYSENGRQVPFETTYGGLYQRAAEHNYKPPFDLPEKWMTRRSKLNLKIPLNFVCTADIIGGNSGSPVVNRNGELVGLIFDGNIQSLTANFIYDDTQSRALAVHSAGIMEALKRIYRADPLVRELSPR